MRHWQTGETRFRMKTHKCHCGEYLIEDEWGWECEYCGAYGVYKQAQPIRGEDDEIRRHAKPQRSQVPDVQE